MAKGASGGSKKRKLTAVVILAVIVLLAAGIVLGITYWPAKAVDVTKSFDEAIETSLNLNDEKGDYKTIKNFIDQNIDEMIDQAEQDTSITDKKDNYVYEMKAFENVMTAVSKVSNYVDLTFESSVKGGFVKKDVKGIQSYLKDSSVSLELMATHIKNHKDELTNFTVVLSVWEGIRDYYDDLLNDYVGTFTLLDKMYKNQNTNGIYGNDAATLSIGAVKSYLTVTYKNLFAEEDSNSENGYNASVLFKTFSNVFEMDSAQNILNYYLSLNCQRNCSAIKQLEKMTDSKVNFDYLIEHNFNVSKLSPTAKQLGYIRPAVELLKGHDLTVQNLTGEEA